MHAMYFREVECVVQKQLLKRCPSKALDRNFEDDRSTLSSLKHVNYLLDSQALS
jgi:hypothetical protein